MTGRRQRPHVPEESRKRVARACDACRRLKEKCDRSQPCTRCTRLNRRCQFIGVTKNNEAIRQNNERERIDDQFYDRDRIEALEEIVKHYTGNSDFSKASLTRTVNSLHHSSLPVHEKGHRSKQGLGESAGSTDDGDEEEEEEEEEASIDTISPKTSGDQVYTGKLSHREFSARVQRKLNEGLRGPGNEGSNAVRNSTDLSRASRLHTQQPAVIDAAAAVPPSEVARFLVEIFFEYAQTNYFYVDEQSLRQKLDSLYTTPRSLGPEDASWLCTLLMVLAVGTQFAHLSSRNLHDDVSKTDSLVSESSPSPDDEAALKFYHVAVTLVPDAISLASIESVQAFLLLGMYTLPIDAAGLSFTYLGIAVKMAVQNGMHRAYHKRMDPRTIEMRNRIWWTVYILEKRVCAMHGLPVSIAMSEVNAAQPSECLPLRPMDRIDTLPNVLAMIGLTSILEEARDSISALRKSSLKSSDLALTSLLRVQQKLLAYWQSLPATAYCKDITPGAPLFRSNVHLALTYHLIHVFIGRNFIFTTPNVGSASPTAHSTSKWEDFRASVVPSCVQNAIDIIELCQMLQDDAGLARASYTEFTSCRAALLVILAQRMQERSNRLRRASEQGLKLLKHMSLGFYSADAEKSQMEAMETAIRRLDHSNRDAGLHKAGPTETAGLAYHHFRNWVMLWKSEGSQQSGRGSPQSSAANTELQTHFDASIIPTLSQSQGTGWDMYLSHSEFELEDGFLFSPVNFQ